MNMENNKFYEDYYDSIFRQANKLSPWEYKNHIISFQINYGKFLPVNKLSKILDVGCGVGAFLGFLKSKGYTDYLGIDCSARQVELCRKNVTSLVKQAEAFGFLKDKKALYDVIAVNDVLEHIAKEDIIKLLELVKEALKEKGILFIRTPNLANPFSLFSRYKDFTHTVGFTERSLRQALWLAGFRDIQVLPFRQKQVLFRIIAEMIYFILKKLFWWQGFVAPEIFTPNLMAVARR